ncbi:MAG: FAD:protein FMN transferase [Acidobacteriota bacterium]
MGTVLDVTVCLPRREEALRAAEKAVAEVARLENVLTTWREGGPLDRINRAPVGEPVAIDAELFALLREVFDWSARTAEAFDPSVLPLVRAWDLRGAGRIASEAELAAAREATGTDRFRLDAAGRTVARRDGRAGIDEGAWGKGYALDRAAEALRGAGVSDALLDLGGELLALGRSPEGTAWTVSIADPRHRRRPVLRLSLPAGHAVSTSGDSERVRRVGGRAIGHLLDPRTGSPAADFGSASVICSSGLVADVLSTAFFVLGPRGGLELSRQLRREGVSNEALFLVVRGSRLEALSSPGFRDLVLSSDPERVSGLSAAGPPERSSR